MLLQCNGSVTCLLSLQYGPRCITLPAPHGDHEVKVTNVRDLTIGYDESTSDQKPVSVSVVQFVFVCKSQYVSVCLV